jgi:hypothetical protein
LSVAAHEPATTWKKAEPEERKSLMPSYKIAMSTALGLGIGPGLPEIAGFAGLSFVTASGVAPDRRLAR